MKNKTLLAELRIHESRPSVKKYITLMDTFMLQNGYASNFFSYLENNSDKECLLKIDELEKIFNKDWIFRNLF